jgi:hypothetical protein
MEDGGWKVAILHLQSSILSLNPQTTYIGSNAIHQEQRDA